MSGDTYYQSPILLHHCCSCNITINEPVGIRGINYGAVYDASKHIFVVKDKIIIKFNSNKYQLEEYHFHIPGEHDLNGQIYESEIHYVFVQLTHGEKYREHNYVCRNVCSCRTDFHDNITMVNADENDRNILVIGRVIRPTEKRYDLSKIQVDLPACYYMYDGTLTTGNFSPVRWLVGDEPIRLNIEEISHFAKDARPIQESDGRIILFSDKMFH